MHRQKKNDAKERFKKTLTKAVVLFSQKKVEESFELVLAVEKMDLSLRQRGQVHKVVCLQLIGTLYGANNLTELSAICGIKSNKASKIWQSLSHSQIQILFNYAARSAFSEQFLALCGQSDASQSRAEATIVGDDSIFKHWFSDEEVGEYFARFFSGQSKSVVYGFCVNLAGIVLKDTFYPLVFSLVKRKESSKSILQANLIEIKEYIDDLLDQANKDRQIPLKLPQLYLSIDSGLSDPNIMDWCEDKAIIFIGVAEKTHIFTTTWGAKGNFHEVLLPNFLREEALFYADKNHKGKPFTLRMRLFYRYLGKNVTVLLFRFNNSKTVSIIFSTDKDIKAITLRRRFFQRTQIEQFFRMVKHTLRIAQSNTWDTSSFRKKIALFFLKAIFAFSFRNFCRTRFKCFKNWGFHKLRRDIIYQNIFKDPLFTHF